MLGRAFNDDREWVALVPDPEVRRARLPQMFDGVVRLNDAGVPLSGFAASAERYPAYRVAPA